MTGRTNQFLLLKDRRFLPLFVTQFTGAFNDNLFKSALSVLVAYGLISTGAWKPEVVVSLTAGFLIFPFVILAPLGGDLADKFDKAHIVRLLKIFEIGIIATVLPALFSHSTPLLLMLLFLFGCQAALFSPAKFALLPQHLGSRELIGGNALLNTGTYLAILAGTILGSLLAVRQTGMPEIAAIFIFSGALGYISSLYIPKAAPPAPHLKLRYNIFSEIFRIIKYARKQPAGVFPAILGISWFYFLGATVLSQFPNFTSQVLKADANVLAFLMMIFSVGVALGGLLNNRLLNAKITARFVPLAGGVMGLFLIDLYRTLPLQQTELIGLENFLHNPEHWRIIFDMLILSVCGGLYVIPLKSIVQHRTRPERRARVMAAGAMMDSLFILTSSGLSAMLLGAGFMINHLFLTLAVATFVVAAYLRKLKEAS